MKRCNACDAEFEDKFTFCPVDATPLSAQEVVNAEVSSSTQGRSEFHLTMIDKASLLERLAMEIRYLSSQLKLAWPKLKRDPIGFAKSLMAESGEKSETRGGCAKRDDRVGHLDVVGAVECSPVNDDRQSTRRQLMRLNSGDSEVEVAEMIEFPPAAETTSERCRGRRWIETRSGWFCRRQRRRLRTRAEEIQRRRHRRRSRSVAGAAWQTTAAIGDSRAHP